MKCHHSGGVHDFAIETDGMTRCPEHGVTLLWHGNPITDAELKTAAAVESRMDEALALVEAARTDTRSAPCRAAADQPHLSDGHTACRRPGCACSCHTA
ncbi:hypothetical protein OG413_42620 [Streptomyces sp. NBC_01433]|uniref:hypothetical protein n=1 Tax=Streptomyces sp. NBC_01433 TaxID=2903864 RepID=UPI002256E69F|nr:hypothetical protein [Streptomyces sp. NBC_01433]MCX4681897.1 hypothetical protein [Streptomyces sp. NBC_01433]